MNVKNNFRYLTLLMISFFGLSCTVKNFPGGNIDDYFISNSENIDMTRIIQRAISKNGQVTLAKGKYIVNGTLKLIDSQSIHLRNGAWLVREKFNKEPMIWINGTYSSVTGGGKNSVIESKVNTPNGLIRMGHKNMSESKKNVLHATLSNIRIKGKAYGGGNDLSIDKGIYMPNPQVKGLASYFHTIQNILISNVDIGIHLSGFANANSISNIVLQGVGNGPEDTGIWVNGAQENRIQDVFHHHSTGVQSTIRVDDLTTNVRTYSSSFNRIENIISEPDAGKSNSKCLVYKSEGTRNYFSLSENNRGGNQITTNFIEKKNILHSSATGRSFSRTNVVNHISFIPSEKAPINSLFVDKKDNKLKFVDSNNKIHFLNK